MKEPSLQDLREAIRDNLDLMMETYKKGGAEGWRKIQQIMIALDGAEQVMGLIKKQVLQEIMRRLMGLEKFIWGWAGVPISLFVDCFWD